jgi:1-acyl-sn-glycerol-3-phosphate acyltransferase
MSLQRGAANIAVRCGSDLRIVTIRCSEALLDKQSKWYNVPLAKPLFEVTVGERLRVNNFYDDKTQEPVLAARQLNRDLLAKLQPVESTLPGINDGSTLP